jgi:hypothetical protein
MELIKNNEILIARCQLESYTAGDDGLYITDIFPGIDASMIGFQEVQ